MEHRRILQEIELSSLPVARACRAMGIGRSTYYRWRRRGVRSKQRGPSWNALSDQERQEILTVSEDHPEWSSRQIAFHVTDCGKFSVSESTVYRLLKRAGKIPMRCDERVRALKEYTEKPARVHDQWQVDFTEFFLPTWGRYHDGGVLDDRSRFLLHHQLRAYQRAEDAIEILDGAVEFALSTHGYVARRVLSDHGKCFEAKDTRHYLGLMNIHPIHARAHHPETVGKLERLHRTMKETVNLHVYDSPEELSRAIDEFYCFYNYERYHESLGNVTPADLYFGRADQVLNRRKDLKNKTISHRRDRYEAWKTEQRALTLDPIWEDGGQEPEQSNRVSLQMSQNVPFL